MRNVNCKILTGFICLGVLHTRPGWISPMNGREYKVSEGVYELGQGDAICKQYDPGSTYAKVPLGDPKARR